MSYNFHQLKRDINTKSSKRPKLFMTGPHWGKSAWNFLYNAVLNFKGDIKELTKFLQALGYVLPCSECKIHYNQYLQDHEIPENIPDIFQWLQNLENTIAQKRFGVTFKPINRYKDVQKVGKTTYVEIDSQPVKQETGCPNCHKNRNNQGTVPGVRMSQRHPFLRERSFFAQKI